MLNKAKLQKIEVLQKKCVSYLTNKKRVNTDTYKALGLLRIKGIIRLQTIKMGYKVQHSQLPIKIIEAFTTDANAVSLMKTHKYQTCRKHEPNRIRAKTAWYSTSFMDKCMAEYQSLPDHI